LVTSKVIAIRDPEDFKANPQHSADPEAPRAA
jgi:hypothetical protein